jgi:hypothetical protein
MRSEPDLHTEYDREKGEYCQRPWVRDADRKAFAWLSNHRTFGPLLPRVAMGFPDAPRTAPAPEPAERFYTWCAWLRWTWSESSDLIPTSWDRKVQMADLVYAYAVSAGSYRPRIARSSPWTQFTARGIDPGATPDPFYDVLLRAWYLAPRMRSCDNPKCRHPFFIASRETQKFCSAKCAELAERQRKLRWWRKYGNKWRTSRRRKSQRKRKGGKRR